MTILLDFLSALYYAVMQLLILVLIPFVWWLLSAKKKQSFLAWIGVYKIPVKKKVQLFIMITIFVVFTSIVFSTIIPQLLGNIANATTQEEGKGIGSIPSILVYSYIQTGLSEELFFRGFIGKRLINKLGFIFGNALQALIFGVIHCLFFITQIDLWRCLVFGTLVAIIAWVQGFLNEKVGEGSLVPSWLSHGTMNALSGIVAAMK